MIAFIVTTSFFLLFSKKRIQFDEKFYQDQFLSKIHHFFCSVEIKTHLVCKN